MTSPNNSNPELTPVENVDIDHLLSQVSEMTNRVQTLMAGNKPAEKNTPQQAASDKSTATAKQQSVSPQKSNPEESDLDHMNDINHLDEATGNQAQQMNENWNANDSQLGADPPNEATGHELDSATDSSHDIVIDEKVNSLAEEEINHMLNRLGKSPSDLSDDTTSSEEEHLQAMMAFPSPIRKILSLLDLVNYPFIWIPTSVRDALGYIAIGTLIFALGLWLFAGIYK